MDTQAQHVSDLFSQAKIDEMFIQRDRHFSFFQNGIALK
jgi:hypothetical protein